MTEHTVKAFDEDIGELRGLIAEMGGLAEQAIARAIDALAKHDLDAARRVIEGDKRIDAIEEDVERLAIRLIALRAPMADDLRSEEHTSELQSLMRSSYADFWLKTQ